MTDAGLHHVVITQIFINSFGFCRGLNYYKSFTHIYLYLIYFFRKEVFYLAVPRQFTSLFYIAAVWPEINLFFAVGCLTAQPDRKLLIAPAFQPCSRGMAVYGVPLA
ncbi:hypothetical protein [Serratia rubidaea]|uniref:Uncharacterized protein n=1 Tax=Serratia rubidaea TaxID=61652 RepID=A0ABS0M9V2_SERRU|nr:hypothetical protein [Serratia rubidaea]MBH1929138.1 hypothetical protein [Serratia rubidaea]MBS0972866.1 hypothetical protein [Serratia rubidaea]MCR0997989.1 hypothetical protein [Serratia rubidaea]MDC6110671.1 hypothetical protein [Serratia rubidaea]MDC6118967.1 hypothetical protein [Serratia rubidaea]